jgi:plastocyanin
MQENIMKKTVVLLFVVFLYGCVVEVPREEIDTIPDQRIREDRIVRDDVIIDERDGRVIRDDRIIDDRTIRDRRIVDPYDPLNDDRIRDDRITDTRITDTGVQDDLPRDRIVNESPFAGERRDPAGFPIDVPRDQQIQPVQDDINRAGDGSIRIGNHIIDVVRIGDAGLVIVIIQHQQVRQSTVEIENRRFLPEVLTVNRGDTVEWMNLDRETHSVTGFGVDEILRRGDTFSYTFNSPGIQHYHSRFLRGMEGTIIVL